MIIYEQTERPNFWTEGFDVTLTEPLTLAFGPGKLFFQPGSGDPVVWDYPAASFVADPDEELPVGYDVYLLDGLNEEGLNVEVVRTELGMDAVQVYEGDTPLLHTLFSFIMQPGQDSLKGFDITVRTIKQSEAGKAGDPNEEDPAETKESDS